MADDKERSENDKLTPGAPVLRFPQEEAVIAPNRLRFIWLPVEGATAYYLEVSRDNRFEDVVFERNVGDATNVSIEFDLPADDHTYYWRVFAGNEHGWSHGENIESFISATDAEVREGLNSPDIDEEFGPVVRMFKGAAAEVAADVTDDDSKLLDEQQEAGVAPEGVEAKQIMGFVLAVLIAVAVIVIIIFTYATMVQQQVRTGAEGSGRYYELQDVRERGRAQIDRYEVIDEGTGQVRIPIERAMELMVEEDANRTSGVAEELQSLRQN
jgi:hypothetical protein